MPISWLDVILIIIMLVSGFLAMVRGFTREVLSIFPGRSGRRST
jgi:membrane protein required for colicin V production